jgi:hypothetical protein
MSAPGHGRLGARGMGARRRRGHRRSVIPDSGSSGSQVPIGGSDEKVAAAACQLGSAMDAGTGIGGRSGARLSSFSMYHVVKTMYAPQMTTGT